MNKCADLWGFVIKVKRKSIKCNYCYINDIQAENKNTENAMTIPVTN